ncbi:hypothetical protein NL676_034669 [Syzygium grande]|nr:hypothetical protein NL676_034669 [Syzygium grande]
MNRSRILAFKNKLPTPVELIPQSWLSPATSQSKSAKPCRSIPKACQRMLDAPYILDDYYLNLLDWGANNMVAIALLQSVYLWNASNGSATELVTFNDEEGPVTSVSWAPDGQNIAIGLQNSHVQLWDFSAQRQLRTFRGGHRLRVCSLAWNNHILTTGGKQLASGGKDNLLYLWDRSRSSLNSGTQWLHRIEDHTAAVKALAWCLFQGNLLASGGSDRSIKFWNTCTGACLNSVDTVLRVRMDAVASAAADEKLMFWHVFGIPELAKRAPKTSSEPFAHWHRTGFVNSKHNDGGWGRNQGYARGRVKEEDMVFVAAEREDIMVLILIHSKTQDTIKNHLLRR